MDKITKHAVISFYRTRSGSCSTSGCCFTFHDGTRANALVPGTVGGFGEFLNSKGFMIGGMLAWTITIFEIAAGAMMAFGLFVKWIAAVFIIELITGIFHVHLPNGWFVVGATQGGMEYSTLLIIALIVTAAHHSGN